MFAKGEGGGECVCAFTIRLVVSVVVVVVVAAFAWILWTLSQLLVATYVRFESKFS